MQGYGFNPGMYPALAAWLIPLALWALVWKGLVLWVAARRGATIWFVVFLILNTVGIGEIIYLLVTDGFKEIQSSKK